jgi:hypothetical protein
LDRRHHNGLLIAGNAPEARAACILGARHGETVWGEHLFPAKGDAVRQWRNQMSANLALAGGTSGFFTSRFPAPWLHLRGTLEATSAYALRDVVYS